MMKFPMKIMNFSAGTEKLRYKFRYNASANLIDATLRYELSLSNNAKYSLTGMQENTIVDYRLSRTLMMNQITRNNFCYL